MIIAPRGICFGGQAVRVAAAVEALMGRADQRRDWGEEGDALEHAGADRRVLVHPLALVGAQRPGLAQDLAGDADLADVVEQGAVAEPVQLDAADAHPGADGGREVGDLVGVVGGVGVLQLDRVGEHADGGEEGALQFGDELAAVDRGADLAGDDVGEQQILLGEGAPGSSCSRFITPQIEPATEIGSESSEPGSVRGLRVR